MIDQAHENTHVYHFSRGKLSNSSRIQYMNSIDHGSIVKTARFLDALSVFRCAANCEKGDVFVFHEQRSLLNLVIALGVRVFFPKFGIVYDMHDLNEYSLAVRRSIWRTVIYLSYRMLEWIACKNKIEIITVSRGLSLLTHRIYSRSAVVVMNGVASPLMEDRKRGNQKTRKNLVYFGAINEERMPIAMLRQLIAARFSVDIYGIVGGAEEYRKEFASVINESSSIKFCGAYSGREIMERLHSYDATIMPYDSDDLNFRYCLPNKLFQSFASGIVCVVNDKLYEAILKFKRYNLVLSTSTLVSLDGVEQADWSVLDALAEKNRRTYAGAIARASWQIKRD